MKICLNKDCKSEFKGKRKNARFCSVKCMDKVAAQRNRDVRKRWQLDNPEKMASYKKKNKKKFGSAYQARRRANQKSAYTHMEDLKSMYTICRKINTLTGSNLQVDHIEPTNGKDISGMCVRFNLQLLDGPMNLKKSNRRDYMTPMDKLRNAKPHSRYPQTVTNP